MKEVYLKKANLECRPVQQEELEQAFCLRHKVFVEKLQWVKGTGSCEEKDEYDEYSIQYGVFDNGKILGVVRITPPTHTFMVEKDFSYLFTSEEKEGDQYIVQNKDESIEISRLGVDTALQGTEKSKVAKLLYRTAYLWCRKNNIDLIYFVSTERLLLSIQKKFGVPIKMISSKQLTEDGHHYYAGLIDLSYFQGFLSRLKLYFGFLLN